MAHFEDFELARSVYRALQDLRSRKTSATVLELDAIAAQAAIPPNWQRRDNRSYVDEARTDAWLAVCRLAAATTEIRTRSTTTSQTRSSISALCGPWRWTARRRG